MGYNGAMKFVTKKQSIQHKNSDTCIAIEYPMADKDLNCALIKLDGRYPETGFLVNKVCKELVYILKGAGVVGLGTGEQTLRADDMLILDPGEKYYFEGQLEMLMPCSPAWYPEQHKEIT